MKKIISLLLTTALSVAYFNAKAQATYYRDIQGQALKENPSADIEGSPYLTDSWTPGTAATDKVVYKNIKLKYDLTSDQPIFAGKDDAPMIFTEPVNKFTIGMMTFEKGFPDIGKFGKDNYYQVLSAGQTKLLKHTAKTIEETKTYGSASSTKRYVDMTGYYLLKNHKMVAIKPDRKSVLAVLTDKAPQLEEYLKANKINFKMDADLGKLLDYYNTLSQ